MICGFIFARGGSKGISDKNIREINGKPLLSYAIECAKKSKHIENIVVSTDSEKIAKVAIQYGAKVLLRPDALAADDSPEILSWKHAIENMPCDVFVSIPATSPLRLPEDVDNCIDCFLLAKPNVAITVTDDSLYTLAYEQDSGYLMRFSAKSRRQDCEPSYRINGAVYVTSPQYINRVGNIWEGNVMGIKMPKERSIDIDDEFDFFIAEQLLKNKTDGSSLAG